ncbi:MAG: hypothetical protein AAFZ18_02200 [Myxococcota bacterium]
MGPPAPLQLPDVEAVQSLYDRGRFLDAYAATRRLWSAPEVVPTLEPEALVLGHRLARYLGSSKISGALARRAHDLAPDRPEVRYFCALDARRRPLGLFEVLESFEETPDLGSGDAELDASWCASHAAVAALFRDFDRAQDRLRRARELAPEDPWIDACEATVHLRAHAWSAGREAAERAFTGRPWGARAAGALAEAMEVDGRFVEASDRLLAAAEAHRQSYFTYVIGLWAGIKGCRRRHVPDPRGWSEARSPLADQLEGLAPLSDHHEQRARSALCAQLALLREDYEAARVHARAVRSPWYTRLADHLDEGAHRPRVLLEHRMLRQDHDTCLPASAAVAMSTVGLDIDHDELVRAVTSDGTPLHRLADWARGRNWTVRYFRATGAAARELIERGLGFVVTIAETDSSHAWACIGFDAATGLALLHDPSTNSLAEMDLDAIAAGQWPWGPRAILIAPSDRAAAAEGLELPDEVDSEALAESHHALDRSGVGAALEQLNASRLGSDWLQLERSLLLRSAGRPSEARVALVELFERAPESVFVRKGLLDTTLDAASFEEGRRTLQAILDARRLPTTASTQAWLEPEPVVEISYAQLLMQSAEHFGEAGLRLARALGRAPLSGYALFSLGKLRDRLDDETGAALAFRLAAAVESERHDYAYAYADCLLRLGREAEGRRYLEARAERRDREVGADGPWRALVNFFENAGRPDEAQSALRRGRELWPKDGLLVAFAAECNLLAGRTEEGRADLEVARASAPPRAVKRVEVLAAQLDGDLARAEGLVADLKKLEPGEIGHRRTLLELVRDQRGPSAAVELISRWRVEGEELDLVELLEIEHLSEESATQEDRARLEARLDARIARHPTDTWALIERAGLYLEAARRIEDPAAALADTRRLAERALAVHPGLASAEALLGRLDEEAGRLQNARDHFARAVSSSPAFVYAIERLGIVTARLGEEAWSKTWAGLDRTYARPGNRCEGIAEAASMLLRQLGRAAADEALDRWGQAQADAPSLAAARAEVALEDRPGAAAAAEVLEGTEALAARHPRHTGLASPRARAFALTADFDRASEAYEALVRAQPRRGELRAQWLEALERSGAVERALEEWRRWARGAPRDAGAVLGWAHALERAGRAGAAIEALREACARAPQMQPLWRGYARLLERQGRREDLLDLAGELERRFPDQAWAAHERGMTLALESVGAPIADVARSFERASELDRRTWSYVCDHTDYLIAQGHFEPARAALEAFLPRASEPEYVLGALAELDDREGQRAQAWQRLEAAFEHEPSYHYGWSLALDWLEDEGDPQRARTMLDRMGPEARKDADLASRRLRVLAGAGAEHEELEPDWLTLLAERPAELTVLARRFDALADGPPDRAEAALRSLERFHAEAPATRARRVRWKVGAGDRAGAIEEVIELVFSPSEAQAAVSRGLDALDGVGDRVRVVRGVRARLAAGAVPLSSHLMALTSHVDDREDQGALELLGAALREAPPLGDPEHAFALVLSKLCGYGNEARTVLRYAEAEQERFDEDDQLWMVRGQAHACLGDAEATRYAMWGWRDRPGVEQWGLGILSWAAFELNDEDEALAVIEHGLFRLPLTGGAPEMARRGCRIALRRADSQAFLQILERLEGVRFGPPTEDDRAFRLFGQLFEGAAAMELDASFRALELDKKDELIQLWKRAIYPAVPWWKKALITVGA